MQMPGLFITFEGGEGAGKTTLIERIYQDLKSQGYSVVKTRAPGGTQLGSNIRELLLHTKEASLGKRAELLLFLADRAQHVEECIFPALKEEKIVLCDRFNDSTIAYQAGARGIAKEKVQELCLFASCGLNPHLTLYLDIDPKIGFERNKRAGLEKDRIEQETLQFHQQIRLAFQQIAQEEPKRVKLINASLDQEEVFKLAKEKIHDLLPTYRK